MSQHRSEWEEAVKFHGHTCVGLAVGFRAAVAGLRELGLNRAGDEEVVAIVENDACGVDAVQVVSGCTLGKGNLFYRDLGKQVFTFGNRKDGRAVRVAVKSGAWRDDGELTELREKVMDGQASDTEKKRFHELKLERAAKVLDIPESDMLSVTSVSLELPEKARIFESAECAVCGEQVMEPRARIKGGKPVCIPCGDSYERGWCHCGK